MELRDLFRNQDATEFCIVTIPTQLAIAESKRLLAALNTQGVAVRNMVVNQVRSFFFLVWCGAFFFFFRVKAILDKLGFCKWACCSEFSNLLHFLVFFAKNDTNINNTMLLP